MLDDRQVERARVLERAAHQARRSSPGGRRRRSRRCRPPSSRRCRRAPCPRGPCVIAPIGRTRTRADLARAPHDQLGHRALVVDRLGVRHAAHGREAAGGRRARAGLDVFLVFLARLAQVDVQVDEARARPTCRVTSMMRAADEAAPDLDDAAVRRSGRRRPGRGDARAPGSNTRPPRRTRSAGIHRRRVLPSAGMPRRRMPTAGIVIIGDEILSGKFVEENAAFLIGELRALGVDLRRITVDPRRRSTTSPRRSCRRQRALRPRVHVAAASARPTTTSRSRRSRAAFGVGVARHPELEAKVRGTGATSSPTPNLRLADIPAGSELVYGKDQVWPVVCFKQRLHPARRAGAVPPQVRRHPRPLPRRAGDRGAALRRRRRGRARAAPRRGGRRAPGGASSAAIRGSPSATSACCSRSRAATAAEVAAAFEALAARLGALVVKREEPRGIAERRDVSERVTSSIAERRRSRVVDLSPHDNNVVARRRDRIEAPVAATIRFAIAAAVGDFVARRSGASACRIGLPSMACRMVVRSPIDPRIGREDRRAGRGHAGRRVRGDPAERSRRPDRVADLPCLHSLWRHRCSAIEVTADPRSRRAPDGRAEGCPSEGRRPISTRRAMTGRESHAELGARVAATLRWRGRRASRSRGSLRRSSFGDPHVLELHDASAARAARHRDRHAARLSA